MLDPCTTGKVGRPRVNRAKEDAVYLLHDQGKTAEEIVQATGLSQAKVYEFIRWHTAAKERAAQTQPDQAAVDGAA